MEERIVASKFHVNNTPTRTLCGVPYTIVGNKSVAPYAFRQIAKDQCRRCAKLMPPLNSALSASVTRDA
jgi:hypothetical protein